MYPHVSKTIARRNRAEGRRVVASGGSVCELGALGLAGRGGRRGRLERSNSSTAPLRLAVIGGGRVVERYHLPAVAAEPEVEPVAAVEPDPQRRAWLERRRPGRMVSADPRAVLDPTRCNVALIASPPASHAELARRCLAAGLSVLVLATGFNRRFRRVLADGPARAGRRRPDGGSSAFTIITDPGRWGLVLEDVHSGLAMLLETSCRTAVDLWPGCSAARSRAFRRARSGSRRRR